MAIDFGAKLGPLPVWGWGLIGGGVVAVGAFFLNRGGSAPAPTTGATLDSSGYQTSGIQGGTATTDDGSNSTFDNNVLWLARASKATANALTVPYTNVFAALTKWTQGLAITTTEQKYVDTAVGLVGAPPEGTQGISTITPDPVKGGGTTTPAPTKLPLPSGSNTTQIWIRGLAGVRRGGLYSIVGKQATFIPGVTNPPANVQVLTNEAQILYYQARIKGLK